MKQIKQYEISLNKGQTYLLGREGQKFCFSCSSGSVWITEDGDPRDYVVSAGQSIELPGGRQIVIEALSDELRLGVEICGVNSWFGFSN